MRRSFLAPEVIQTSAMDCGPASLKCLLDGLGIPVSYGRLREACQTEVDGTSIDTLEDVALRLGLDAAQVMVPADHVFVPEAGLLPALAVVRLPNGFTHFVVLWRRVGPWVQLMDPGRGRIWINVDRFTKDLFIHEMRIPEAPWREWMASQQAQDVLHRRLRDLDIDERGRNLVQMALSDPSWKSIAVVDAASRALAALVKAGGVRKGCEASELLASLVSADAEVPEAYFAVRPARAEGDEPQLMLRGAVLVTIAGLRTDTSGDETPLPTELSAALSEPTTRPSRELLRLMLADGAWPVGFIVLGFALASAGVVVEALAFRSLLDLGRRLELPDQRLGAVLALILFMAALALLETSIAHAVVRVGRRIESRLRIALFEKLPRLGDRYFRSRPTSDMAERSHSVHLVRGVPLIAERLIQGTLGLVATVGAIAWLDPRSGFIALLCALTAVAVPFTFRPLFAERDLRVRSHHGALARFHLDSLLGLVAVRTHAAEKAVESEHESLLVEWARASRAMLGAVVAVAGAQSILGFGIAAIVVLTFTTRTTDIGALLLSAYWALLLPVYGEDIAEAFFRYPSQRNVVLRHLELIRAFEAPGNVAGSDSATEAPSDGARVTFEEVTVRAGGHAILERIDLSIDPGQHVAILGPSGAGKSSLIGLLLGWHSPSEGRVLVDDESLNPSGLEALRVHTAWIDPEVQIWNRTFVENLLYGASDDPLGRLSSTIDEADLLSLLETLPDGLSTALGEGGGLVSGGEGQRVRIGRAFLRGNVRLALLDEPFRGLDRQQRALLLRRTRQHFQNATFLFVTHDVSHSREFDRVLVVEGGRIVEDGCPARLAEDRSSHLYQMLEAEDVVRDGLWEGVPWRRLVLSNGRLGEMRGSES